MVFKLLDPGSHQDHSCNGWKIDNAFGMFYLIRDNPTQTDSDSDEDEEKSSDSDGDD